MTREEFLFYKESADKMQAIRAALRGLKAVKDGGKVCVK